VTLAHTSPFLGTMTPGQTIQARILRICLPWAIFVLILNSLVFRLFTVTPGQTIQAHILHICLPWAIFVLILNSVSFPDFLPWRRARPSRHTFFIYASLEPYLSLYLTLLVFPSFYRDAGPDHSGTHSSYLPPLRHICRYT
jgi:hypothetical protein